ncbi:hypothetical protein GIB67_008219, partial [Kingdonia uniflora]
MCELKSLCVRNLRSIRDVTFMVDLVKSWSLQRKKVKGVVLLGFNGGRGSSSWLPKREIKAEKRLKGFKKKVCNMVFVEVIFDVLDGSLMFLLSLINLCED